LTSQQGFSGRNHVQTKRTPARIAWIICGPLQDILEGKAKEEAYLTHADSSYLVFKQRYLIEANRPHKCPGAILHLRIRTVIDNIPMLMP
jgi:hypothetical protein